MFDCISKNGEGPDQTARMRRLIWTTTIRILHKALFASRTIRPKCPISFETAKIYDDDITGSLSLKNYYFIILLNINNDHYYMSSRPHRNQYMYSTTLNNDSEHRYGSFTVTDCESLGISFIRK